MIGYAWYPSSSPSNIRYFLENSAKHKAIVQQLDFIREFIQDNVNIELLWSWKVDMENTSQNMQTILEGHWVWRSQCMEWTILEIYFLMNSPVGWYMNQASNSQGSSVCILQVCNICIQVSCVILSWWLCWWYTYEELVKWFVDTLGKILHAKFLGYTHWLVSISISQLNDHSISVDQARYVTPAVEKYLGTSTIKES